MRLNIYTYKKYYILNNGPIILNVNLSIHFISGLCLKYMSRKVKPLSSPPLITKYKYKYLHNPDFGRYVAKPLIGNTFNITIKIMP